MRADPRPPRLVAALIRLLLPAELEEPVLGDLAEEHEERCREEGRLRAALWYCLQLAALRPLRLRTTLRRLEGAWLPGGGRPRNTTRTHAMEALAQTLRHSGRRLARTPGFTAVAILSLGLGIGANTAVFSLVNAIFLRGRDIAEPERVVQVFRHSGGPYWRATWEDYRRMRDDLGDLFSHVMTHREDGVRVGDSDDVVAALRVSGDYFGVMGRPPALGRGFIPGGETDVEGSPAVAILSHDLWQGAFGGDPDIVGREVRINAQPTTVVGVIPEDFTAKATGIAVDVLIPDAAAVGNPGNDNVWIGARMAPGVTLEQVRAGLARVAAAYNEGRPETLRPIRFNVVSEADVRVHPGFDRTLASIAALLFAVVGVTLLIACTNLASFLLARAVDRRKEFAVRMALGAGRGRILGQFLVEALVLGALGGVAGLFLARIGLDLLMGVQPPLPVDVNLDVSPDWRVLGFTAGVSLLAGALFGMIPAVQASRGAVAPTLRDESGGSTGTRRKVTLRGTLVAAQVTLSLVLLMAAGLFLRSLLTAASIDPGFEPDRVALVTVDAGTTGYAEGEARRLYDDLLRQARELPGVEAAALGTRIPLQLGNWRSGIQRTDVTPVPGREWRYAEIAMVSPGYFETLGIELRRGRAFEETDVTDARPVVVLNQTAVRMLWGDEAAGADPVGQPLTLSWADREGRVVGVVEDTKVTSLGETPEPMVYTPLAQRHAGSVLLVARTTPPATGAVAERLRATAKGLDPDLYVHGAMTGRRSAGLALFLPRMGASLLAAFGVLALLMAGIGLYGVVSYTVRQRQKEVGIRLSLGATSDQVVRMVMAGGLGLVVAGVVVGMAAAVPVGQVLERFLFGVSGADPVTFVFVPVFLLAVAALAAWLPARRASRVDPARALRSD